MNAGRNGGGGKRNGNVAPKSSTNWHRPSSPIGISQARNFPATFNLRPWPHESPHFRAPTRRDEPSFVKTWRKKVCIFCERAFVSKKWAEFLHTLVRENFPRKNAPKNSCKFSRPRLAVCVVYLTGLRIIWFFFFFSRPLTENNLLIFDFRFGKRKFTNRLWSLYYMVGEAVGEWDGDFRGWISNNLKWKRRRRRLGYFFKRGCVPDTKSTVIFKFFHSKAQISLKPQKFLVDR